MTFLELTTAPNDMGKIIGRQGRTAAALRTLLASMGLHAEMVEVPRGTLHLKSDCSLVDEETLLATEELARVDASAAIYVDVHNTLVNNASLTEEMQALERLMEGLYTPHKVKCAVTGCPRNCAEATVKDIGLVGQEGGWQVVVGGAAGKTGAAAMLATGV